MERQPEYPPEYDNDYPCDVCGKSADDCDCPECSACGAVGDPSCYEHHGLKPAHDSIQAFCEHIGISPLRDALRAVDKHNVEHVWVVTACGVKLMYDSAEGDFEVLSPWTRLTEVGVGGIAWDGSDWEWSTEVPAGGDWLQLDEAREAFNEALDDHRVMQVPGYITEWLNARDFTTLDYLDDNLPEDVLDDLCAAFPELEE